MHVSGANAAVTVQPLPSGLNGVISNASCGSGTHLAQRQPLTPITPPPSPPSTTDGSSNEAEHDEAVRDEEEEKRDIERNHNRRNKPFVIIDTDDEIEVLPAKESREQPVSVNPLWLDRATANFNSIQLPWQVCVCVSKLRSDQINTKHNSGLGGEPHARSRYVASNRPRPSWNSVLI